MLQPRRSSSHTSSPNSSSYLLRQPIPHGGKHAHFGFVNGMSYSWFQLSAAAAAALGALEGRDVAELQAIKFSCRALNHSSAILGLPLPQGVELSQPGEACDPAAERDPLILPNGARRRLNLWHDFQSWATGSTNHCGSGVEGTKCVVSRQDGACRRKRPALNPRRAHSWPYLTCDRLSFAPQIGRSRPMC